MLPLEVTSLLPVVMLPMLGIMSTGDVAREYLTGPNMLLLAAMGVAAAAQVSTRNNTKPESIFITVLPLRMSIFTKDWQSKFL